MNLENLNLVELNAQEVQEIDGGWLDWFINIGFPGFSWDSGDYTGHPPRNLYA